MSYSKLLALCLTTAAIWLTAVGRILAQPPTPAGSAGSDGSTDYVLSYMVVILSIGLGVFAVARSSNRRERERPAGYVAKSAGDEH